MSHTQRSSPSKIGVRAKGTHPRVIGAGRRTSVIAYLLELSFRTSTLNVMRISILAFAVALHGTPLAAQHHSELAAIFAVDPNGRVPERRLSLSPSERDSVLQSVVSRDRQRFARTREIVASTPSVFSLSSCTTRRWSLSTARIHPRIARPTSGRRGRWRSTRSMATQSIWSRPLAIATCDRWASRRATAPR
jgi:hypothetical protein